MPSPDATPYVDLTLLDVSSEQLAAASVHTLASRLPGWQPREASTEVMLLETSAVMVAELIYAINRLPGAVLETLLRLFDLDRSLGTPATAYAELTVVDALGHTIPAGTRLRLDIDPGTEPVTFTLDADLVVDPGDTAGVAAITAVESTTTPNGAVVGTTLIILDAVPAVSAKLTTSPAGGTGPEDGAAFLERATPVLARLTDTLVLPDHFTARALELGDQLVAPVYRARTLNLYDADTDTPDSAGHVTVAVLARDGAELTGPQLTAVDNALEAQALASLSIHVINATVTAVPVEAQVTIRPGYNEAQVLEAAADAVRAWLDPNAWEWSDTVRENELIALLDNVAGVDYVEWVLLDGDPVDFALTGPANLAAAGTVDVHTAP